MHAYGHRHYLTNPYIDKESHSLKLKKLLRHLIYTELKKILALSHMRIWREMHTCTHTNIYYGKKSREKIVFK